MIGGHTSTASNENGNQYRFGLLFCDRNVKNAKQARPGQTRFTHRGVFTEAAFLVLRRKTCVSGVRRRWARITPISTTPPPII